jgi:hypothetical protein
MAGGLSFGLEGNFDTKNLIADCRCDSQTIVQGGAESKIFDWVCSGDVAKPPQTAGGHIVILFY